MAVSFFQLLLLHTHTMKNGTCAGGKYSKVHVTILLCFSMDHGTRQKLFVIEKSAKPRDLRWLPAHYKSNSKACMTSVLFSECLVELVRQIAAKRWKILLLLSNCSMCYVDPCLTNTTCMQEEMSDAAVVVGFIVTRKVMTVKRRTVISRPLNNVPWTWSQICGCLWCHVASVMNCCSRWTKLRGWQKLMPYSNKYVCLCSYSLLGRSCHSYCLDVILYAVASHIAILQYSGLMFPSASL